MTALPLLLTIDSPISPPRLSLNGFPATWLVNVKANHRAEALGLAGQLKGYAVIHPYFLMPQGNRLRAEGPRSHAGNPPANLELRVARLDFQPDQPADTEFASHELLRLSQPVTAPAAGEPATYSLQGQFDWPGLPAWRWTQDPPIADTPAHLASLRTAVDAAWTAIYRMGGGHVDRAWVDAARGSTRDFAQASELGGRPYRTLDTLVEVASTLKLPGDDSPDEFERKRAAKAGADVQGQGGRIVESPDGGPAQRAHGPAERDAPARFEPTPRLPNGQLPPRLRLRALSSFGALHLQLLGEGRLARLTDGQGSPLLQFISNYRDGSRDAGDALRYSADLWFRLNAQQQWELAAVYPSGAVGPAGVSPPLDAVVKGLPY